MTPPIVQQQATSSSLKGKEKPSCYQGPASASLTEEELWVTTRFCIRSLMVLPWCKDKIWVFDLPTLPLAPWPYLYGKRRGPHGDSSMTQPVWAPIAPSPKVVNGKRLVMPP